MTALPAKDPSEKYPVTFGLAAVLKNETITGSPEIEVEVIEGADPAPSGILLNAPTVNGSDVTQWVQGGLHRVDYLLRLTIDTSGGRRLVATATLPVRRKG